VLSKSVEYATIAIIVTIRMTISAIKNMANVDMQCKDTVTERFVLTSVLTCKICIYVYTFIYVSIRCNWNNSLQTFRRKQFVFVFPYPEMSGPGTC